MGNNRKVDEEFEELNRKARLVSDDNVDTFFDLTRINDEKLRARNIVGFARNLIRDYDKDGSLEDLAIFLDNIAEIVRKENGV